MDELFAVRPEDFVAARNALVKRLKAAGERDRAAEVATWRRPTPIDWALNQVARDDADAIDRFTGAAAAAQEAQAAALSGRGEDLRAAVAEVRESSATVAALAAAALAGQGRPTASARAAVSTRLAEIAAEPSLAAQLAHGRLGAGAVEADGAFGFGAAEDGPTPAPARRASAPHRVAPGCSQSPARTPPRPASRRQQRRSVNASRPAPSRRPNGPTRLRRTRWRPRPRHSSRPKASLRRSRRNSIVRNELGTRQPRSTRVVAMRPTSRRRRWRRRANSEALS